MKKTPVMAPYANMSHMEVVQELLAAKKKLEKVNERKAAAE